MKNEMLMTKITSMKVNSIVNIRREESMNHMIQKILKLKNRFFDTIEDQETQMETLKGQITYLKRTFKTILEDKKARIKVLNQNMKSIRMENKSLKVVNSQLHIGNSEVLEKLKQFEEIGFDLNLVSDFEEFRKF
jgi:regulator of replication initiation timing